MDTIGCTDPGTLRMNNDVMSVNMLKDHCFITFEQTKSKVDSQQNTILNTDFVKSTTHKSPRLKALKYLAWNYNNNRINVWRKIEKMCGQPAHNPDMKYIFSGWSRGGMLAELVLFAGTRDGLFPHQNQYLVQSGCGAVFTSHSMDEFVKSTNVGLFSRLYALRLRDDPIPLSSSVDDPGLRSIIPCIYIDTLTECDPIPDDIEVGKWLIEHLFQNFIIHYTYLLYLYPREIAIPKLFKLLISTVVAQSTPIFEC